jgi:WD40 repeat protein
MNRMPCLACFALVAASPLFAGESGLRQTLEGHEGNVYSVKFSPDGKILASSDENGTIHLWDPTNGKKIAAIVVPRAKGNPKEKILVRSLAFSPDGKTLAAGTTGSTSFGVIRLWDVATRKNTAEFKGEGAGRADFVNGVYSVAFSPDGKTLASGHEDDVVLLWDLSNGKFITTYQADPGDKVYSVCFSPDGKNLATGGSLGVIKIWDLSKRESTADFKAGGPGNSANSVVYSPNGKVLAAGCWLENGAMLWDVASGKNVAKFKPVPADSPAKNPNDMTYSVAFSPDGALLASGCDNGIIGLWDVAKAKKIAILSRHTDLVRSLAFSADGKILASGSRDGTIKLWNVKDAEPGASKER